MLECRFSINNREIANNIQISLILTLFKITIPYMRTYEDGTRT
jgi:hypothetical protein